MLGDHVCWEIKRGLGLTWERGLMIDFVKNVSVTGNGLHFQANLIHSAVSALLTESSCVKFD